MFLALVTIATYYLVEHEQNLSTVKNHAGTGITQRLCLDDVFYCSNSYKHIFDITLLLVVYYSMNFQTET